MASRWARAQGLLTEGGGGRTDPSGRAQFVKRWVWKRWGEAIPCHNLHNMA